MNYFVILLSEYVDFFWWILKLQNLWRHHSYYSTFEVILSTVFFFLVGILGYIKIKFDLRLIQRMTKHFDLVFSCIVKTGNYFCSTCTFAKMYSNKIFSSINSVEWLLNWLIFEMKKLLPNNYFSAFRGCISNAVVSYSWVKKLFSITAIFALVSPNLLKCLL